MTGASAASQRPKSAGIELSPVHYVRIIMHRKVLVLSVFVAVSIATAVVASRLPNVYTSETVILVDPQKVPESYVKPTVTGDVRGRLGTLTQQILSATRLQKIIETYGLYAQERKRLAREDVIARMRADVNIAMVTGGAQQSLEAFKITYSGKDPRLVAQVTNQLAALFIDENLKAREQQATDTTDFLHQQLDETRKTLDAQEAQLRDFRLKHLGEMPEHQVANLTVLGQLQASLQQEAEAIGRAEQQRAYIQSMMAQSTPVVDLDTDNDGLKQPAAPKPGKPASPAGTIMDDKARLAVLLTRYTESHPEVQKLRAEIADKETAEGRLAAERSATEAEQRAAANEPEPVAPAKRRPPLVTSTNPVLVSQIRSIEAEITKHKEERERLSKLVGTYRTKLEAIPVREQQIAQLVRDYEINKVHYTQLLDKQLSAETATQLEIRQKGEQFSVLDPAQPAQRPSSPKRMLIDLAGSVLGLVLGCVLAIIPEFFGASITSIEHIPQTQGNRILEIIPIIATQATITRHKRRFMVAAASGVVATLAFGAVVLYRFGWLSN
jgi:polysaccharide biosynthesis transport protein